MKVAGTIAFVLCIYFISNAPNQCSGTIVIHKHFTWNGMLLGALLGGAYAFSKVNKI